MADPSTYNSQLISSLLAGNGGVSKGLLGSLLPDIDVTGGLRMQVAAIGANPLNTPLARFLAGGGYGRKPGQQALIAKIGQQISADFQQANQAGQALRQQLAAGVESSMVQSGLPRDLKGGNDTGGRGV